jgi:hypothetical protein
MVFQKGKPRPPLKVKTCVICRKSFQPSSGAQKICMLARKNRPEGSDVPDLELDLTPLAAYIKAMIADALTHMQSSPDKSDEELREMIRELVREEIASRLKPLFEMG